MLARNLDHPEVQRLAAALAPRAPVLRALPDHLGPVAVLPVVHVTRVKQLEPALPRAAEARLRLALQERVAVQVKSLSLVRTYNNTEAQPLALHVPRLPARLLLLLLLLLLVVHMHVGKGQRVGRHGHGAQRREKALAFAPLANRVRVQAVHVRARDTRELAVHRVAQRLAPQPLVVNAPPRHLASPGLPSIVHELVQHQLDTALGAAQVLHLRRGRAGRAYKTHGAGWGSGSGSTTRPGRQALALAHWCMVP